jgi:hypothetical protein
VNNQGGYKAACSKALQDLDYFGSNVYRISNPKKDDFFQGAMASNPVLS